MVKKRFFPLIAILVLAIVFAGIFMLRSPVIIVEDSSFSLLYGSLRARFVQAGVSLRLGRRVLRASVSESAGSDVIALGIRAYSEGGFAGISPYAALFPYRYAEAARRYKAESPGVKVLLLEGRVRGPRPAEEGDVPLLFATDTRADFYRAGLIAAGLVGGTEEGIMVFQDGTMNSEDREAFIEGLRAQGFEKNPSYLSINADNSAWQNIGCVVINGPAAHFFEKNLKIPVILFTWADPGVTPWGVKAIFDDSPWALAVEAVRAAEAAQATQDPQAPQHLPSRIIFPSKRIEDKERADSLKKLAKEAYIGKTGDNL
ncbi:hypothetical protein [Leadbettera azotonutricia]|uniref:Periplasmic binding protein domain-containing protein n=1 Tax=Leadbettera azotonutricia (strain ATCC BAA-888 / DSM 13862 / ZAS-9) TaxID=545695 RepID=F5Y8W9_LEAAZ|nr:hypothetical protein [Leadbettera azotonutricia]AEF82162.1 hypothetical protein TREAZ_0915 [Leadbettera azotonutricia ZAS-9]